jgi:hypothetical protein
MLMVSSMAANDMLTADRWKRTLRPKLKCAENSSLVFWTIAWNYKKPTCDAFLVGV